MALFVHFFPQKLSASKTLYLKGIFLALEKLSVNVLGRRTIIRSKKLKTFEN